MEEKYKAYLEMPYEEFYKKTCMRSRYDSGSYKYYVVNAELERRNNGLYRTQK